MSSQRKCVGLCVLLLGLALALAVSYRPPSVETPGPLNLPSSTKSAEPAPQLQPGFSPSEMPPQVVSASSAVTPPPSALATETQHQAIPETTTNRLETAHAEMPPPPEAIPAEPVAVLPKEETRPLVYSSGSRTLKQVALTFDDGPHPIYTPKVLDELRARNIKATFFVLGERVRLYPWVLRQIAAEGHEIGNHTYSHHLLVTMSDEMIEHEITATQDEIRKAIGYQTHLFRPPYGAYRPDTRAIFREHNLNIILWSVDPKDWSVHDSLKISHAVTSQSKNGSIILCHDIHKTTLLALPEMLDTLIAEGYEFKTVSQLCKLPDMDIITAAAKTGSANPIP